MKQDANRKKGDPQPRVQTAPVIEQQPQPRTLNLLEQVENDPNFRALLEEYLEKLDECERTQVEIGTYPPEPNSKGPVEYKLKLVHIDRLILERRATQFQWRMKVNSRESDFGNLERPWRSHLLAGD